MTASKHNILGLTHTTLGTIGHAADELLDATEARFDEITKALAESGERVEDLVCNRESDRHADLEFDGQVQQSAGLFPDLPGIHAIATLGAKPCRARNGTITVHDTDDQGTPITATLSIETVKSTSGTSTAALFSYKGVHYLYAMMSAARADEDGNAEWTEILVSVLRRLRPRNLRTVTFSRFVRNQDQAGLLLHACSRYVERVWAGQIPMDMQGPLAPAHKAMFGLLAMASSMERDWIVGRMLAGRVAAWTRNEWPWASVPPGHRKKAKQLEPDTSATTRRQIAELLELVALRLPPARFLRGLADIGIGGTEVRLSDGSVREKDVSMLSATSKQRWAMSWVPLLVTGDYTLTLPNPFPGAEQVAGEPIHRDRTTELGELRLLYKIERPAGGWHRPEIEQAALAAALDYSANLDRGRRQPSQYVAVDGEQRRVLNFTEMGRNVSAKRDVGILTTNTNWTQDGWEYRLRTVSIGQLRLIRWPARPEPTGDRARDQVSDMS